VKRTTGRKYSPEIAIETNMFDAETFSLPMFSSAECAQEAPTAESRRRFS